MSGALWAAVSGIGFGIFQVLNARAVRHLTQVYVATFAQLATATVVFVAIVAFEGGAPDVLDIPPAGLVLFSLSGVLHFFLGWTTLNQSQAMIGAARTSPLLATTPVFGLLIAFGATGAVPSVVALLGIGITVVGAYVVTDPGRHQRAGLISSRYALATSAAWSLSAVVSVAGLREFEDPLLGVTVGMAAASLAYGLLLCLVPVTRGGRMTREAWGLKIIAGVVIAFATWWRWLGLAGAPVGVVLALQLLTVPTVLVIVALKPSGEVLGSRVWVGAALVMTGVGLLIAFP